MTKASLVDGQPPIGLLNGAAAVAAYLGIPKRTVYYLVQTGKLPVVRLGTRICCRPETIHAWFRDQENASTLDKKDAESKSLRIVQ